MSHKPINRELYEKTRAFVISALKLLISYLHKGEQVPYRIVEKNIIRKEGTWSTTHIPQPLYFVLVERHRKEVESLPEYKACIEVMRSDITISKHLDCLVGFWNRRVRIIPWEYLSHFLTKQLAQLSERFEFDAEYFDRMYYDLEHFFYSDSVGLQAFSPLHNFSGDVDGIDLGDGLRIRTISTSELEQLLDEAKWSFQIPYFDVPLLKYAIELTYKTKKVFGEPPVGKAPSPDVDVNETFTKLVTALRLFKSGTVGFNIIKTLATLDVPGLMGGTRSGLEYKKYFGQTYTLTGTEVSKFKSFWNRFNQIHLEQPAPLSVAIRRFNYAYERNRLEDKLIDYMITFEALFFKQGETGEFRHKLAVRVSRLLKQDYMNRKETMKQMMEFYDKRSAVVHGEKVDISSEFINSVEDTLRKSIKQFLQRLQTFSHDVIISHLDLD